MQPLDDQLPVNPAREAQFDRFCVRFNRASIAMHRGIYHGGQANMRAYIHELKDLDAELELVAADVYRGQL